jgi:hypothetical protein
MNANFNRAMRQYEEMRTAPPQMPQQCKLHNIQAGSKLTVRWLCPTSACTRVRTAVPSATPTSGATASLPRTGASAGVPRTGPLSRPATRSRRSRIPTHPIPSSQPCSCTPSPYRERPRPAILCSTSERLASRYRPNPVRST